jgi:hypothetical protein
MEMSQGNTLCSYRKQKCHFFFYKIGEQEGRTGSVWGAGTSQGVGQDAGKGCRRMNIV